MILVVPFEAVEQHLRYIEEVTDEDGTTANITRRLATKLKLDDGTLLDIAQTLFGDPLTEPEGTTGRRGGFSHPWSAEEVAWMRDFIAGLPKQTRDKVSLVEALPADWRHPTEA